MAKVYASLIKKGLMELDDIKNEALRKEVEKILNE
jgi:hypothetical protein